MEAVKSGDPTAQYKLGLFYLEGSHGLKQNYSEAARWFRRSAEKGNSSAMFQLGKLYEEGSGVEQDTDEALKWYQAAADGGNEEAKSRLKASILEANSVVNNSTNDENDAKTRRFISTLSHAVVISVLVTIIGGVLLALGIKLFALSIGDDTTNDVAVGIGLVGGIILAIVPLRLFHLFYRSFAEIIGLLLDIKNILQKNNDHKGV